MSEQNDDGTKYFEKMLNIIDVGVHLIDNKGITIFYNDKMAETDGFNREQVVGKNLFDLFPSLTNETSTFMKVLQTGMEIREKIQTYVSVTGKRITTINSTYPHFGKWRNHRCLGSGQRYNKHCSSPRPNTGSQASTLRISAKG